VMIPSSRLKRLRTPRCDSTVTVVAVAYLDENHRSMKLIPMIPC
jgi:hypothetical protein